MHAPLPRNILRTTALAAAMLALAAPAAWAQTATSAPQATAKARARPPQAAAAQTVAAPANGGDYIVAIVNRDPITNVQVRQHAQLLAQRMRADNVAVPERPALLQLALQQLVARQALMQSVRDSAMPLTDEDIDVAEARNAASRKLTPAQYRQSIMASRHLTETQFRKELADQIQLERVREARMQAAASKVTDQEAMQWLRTRKQAAGAAHSHSDLHLLDLAQVLIVVPEGASAVDEARLRAKAQEALHKIQTGTDFAAVVYEYTDGAGRTTGGDMGMRPETDYPAEFISAVRHTAIGQTTPIVRTVAGFHILKVIDRQQAAQGTTQEQTHARHILLRASPQMTLEQAMKTLADIRTRIVAGKLDFASAARQYSQDASAEQGGDLGLGSTDQFVPEFAEVLDTLQAGQISQPFASRYGVHLAQVLERHHVPLTQAQELAAARKLLGERKAAEALQSWEEEAQARAYVELRQPPQ